MLAIQKPDNCLLCYL